MNRYLLLILLFFTCFADIAAQQTPCHTGFYIAERYCSNIRIHLAKLADTS